MEFASGAITYTVHIYHHKYYSAVTHWGVDQRMIQMMDVPYLTDWHRCDAFCHFIGIPDEIFPSAWKFNRTDFEDTTS